MSSKVIVLDANILIRAVLGAKVRDQLMRFKDVVTFLTPDICFDDANKYLPELFEKRCLSPQLALEVLAELKKIIQIVDKEVYAVHAEEAKQRIKARDFYDWPIVATALAFRCPVWTEDRDFFGSGLSVWTSDRIHIFPLPTYLHLRE